VAREVARDQGVDLKITLLDGKAFDRILRYVHQTEPWMLVLGRIGVHSDEEMDIGSNTENLLRMVPCNVLISNRVFVPPISTTAEYTMAWTEEAKLRMEKVPVFARGMAKTAIYKYALEKGHTIISNSVVDAAMVEIMPRSATTTTRPIWKRSRSFAIIAANALGSAVRPGRMSHATGQPWPSTATHSTICGWSGRRSCE
jgi:hypothetical protein